MTYAEAVATVDKVAEAWMKTANSGGIFSYEDVKKFFEGVEGYLDKDDPTFVRYGWYASDKGGVYANFDKLEDGGLKYNGCSYSDTMKPPGA